MELKRTSDQQNTLDPICSQLQIKEENTSRIITTQRLSPVGTIEPYRFSKSDLDVLILSVRLDDLVLPLRRAASEPGASC